ncbi:MAG: DMT family transporter [SAR202 cluster bacterium]|nr:DMT family transporter [SAR202 cluster bacterium]
MLNNFSIEYKIRFYLVIGVFAVSTAAILIKLSSEAHPLAIAFYRMFISILVFVIIALIYRHRRLDDINVFTVNNDQVVRIIISSLGLAMHFWFWVWSLSFTSVASSVLLVTTNPFIVLLFSWIIWSHPIRLKMIIGMFIGLIGGSIIIFGDSHNTNNITGDLLALLGSLCIVPYVLCGRSLRKDMHILTYNLYVYGLATIFLFILIILFQIELFNLSLYTYFMLFLVALIPQVIGHSLLNWVLGYASAVLVTISVMAEPIIATILAGIILDEIPSLYWYLGGFLILLGIYLSISEFEKDFIDNDT